MRDIEHPVKRGKQPTGGEDKPSTEHNRTDDADNEGAPLVFRWIRKVGEENQKHKNVVNRERFLDQKAGYELKRIFSPNFGPNGSV